MYSINDLERLTGIKAHTIRIWERRYGLLTPDRTDTNIRTYNDEALRKILNVNTLLRDGWKISKISALNSQELESHVWSMAKSGKSVEHVYDIYIQALISASLSFDEEWFDGVFEDISSRFGLSITMQNIIGPFMERIGLMWTVLKMHPGQEHFASNLVRRKLLTAIDKLPRLRSKSRYVLCLPPWEDHEIGLIYAWYLLKSSGYDVVYLGQSVPVDALVQSVEVTDPKSVLTFITTEEAIPTVQEFIDKVTSHFPKVELCIAARDSVSSQFVLPANVKILNSPQALIDLL